MGERKTKFHSKQKRDSAIQCLSLPCNLQYMHLASTQRYRVLQQYQTVTQGLFQTHFKALQCTASYMTTPSKQSNRSKHAPCIKDFACTSQHSRCHWPHQDVCSGWARIHKCAGRAGANSPCLKPRHFHWQSQPHASVSIYLQTHCQ